MLWMLIFVPLAAAVASFLIRSDALRRMLLIAAALCHTAAAACCWVYPTGPILGGWFDIDPIAQYFLTLTSVLFLAGAFYAVGYLKAEQTGRKKDFMEDAFFINAPQAVFIGCLLLFLTTMTMVLASQHFGLLWVAMEATTLVSAPLIYFHRHHRSLEATWKYLLICSVGIALALLGNFFLAIAASGTQTESISLLRNALIANGSKLSTPWIQAAFIFFLVGYGTKMGLAPLHTWLPDAHSEAPSVVSSLLSGALLNCAFVGILRAFEVACAAGQTAFAQDLLVLFGLVSIAFAAVFIIGQADYKRLLAYSSVEHMGILALGTGLGQAAVSGAMLHAVNHSLTKAVLFMTAGNILAVYKTKTASRVRGLFSVMPVSGLLWVAGLLAITGFPPFGTFLSEFTILQSAVEQGYYGTAAAFLILLGFIFIGFSAIALRMTQGQKPESVQPACERPPAVVPPLVLITAVLLLGVYVPEPVNDMLHRAAVLLGGR